MNIKCNQCGSEIFNEGVKKGNYSTIYTCDKCGEKSLIIDVDRVIADRDILTGKVELAGDEESKLIEKREYYASTVLELYNEPVKNPKQVFEISSKISYCHKMIDEIDKLINHK